MQNRDTTAALAYHESTKLAYINLANKPPLYKSYSGLPTLPLPIDFALPATPTLEAVSAFAPSAFEPSSGPEPSLSTLAQLLYFSAGVIRTGVFRTAGEVHFRAAASAGGLYPVETYLACRDIPGLAAGVYHFSPDRFSLTQLREGDYRSALAAAAGAHPQVAASPFTIIFSTVFWRSSWKYRTRGYRYCFWDNGTIIANLLATASAAGLPAQVVNAFLDSGVNELVGIDGVEEAATCLVPIGSDAAPVSAAPGVGQLEPVGGTSVITAPGEIDYPEIRQTHDSTLLTDVAEIAGCRGGLNSPVPAIPGGFYPLPGAGDGLLTSNSLGQTIKERGSTRRFERTPIPFISLGAILDCSTRGVPSDFLDGSVRGSGDSLLSLYIIANAVDGLAPGAYYFSPKDKGLAQLKEGAFREEAGHLGFEQALPADASAVVFFMADLAQILQCYGNRGYRAAQLEAGIVGGKLYLSAHSLGLGASGLTFYDDEVTDFFSPHAAGKSAMFVVPLGVTAAQNRVRPFRSRIAMDLDARSRGARRA